jgi:beta-galactosidase/beta-glucuronidase
MFRVAQYQDGSLGFFVADEIAVVCDGGNLGNRTSIVTRETGADHPEWARWHVEFVRH